MPRNTAKRKGLQLSLNEIRGILLVLLAIIILIYGFSRFSHNILVQSAEIGKKIINKLIPG